MLAFQKLSNNGLRVLNGVRIGWEAKGPGFAGSHRLYLLRSSAQCAFWVVRWPCSQNGPVSDTIRRRGGNRGIFSEEGVDTVAYFGENLGSRV